MQAAHTAHAEQVATNLFQGHRRALLHYMIQLTGDPQRAEDLFQETLLRAWLHADKLIDNAPSQRAWLFRVARNLAIDDMRHRRTRPAEVHVEELPPQADDTDGVLNTMEAQDLLRQLTPGQRSVLLEVFYRGSTITEAARNLSIPHGTAKSRFHYGLRQLRQSHAG